MRFTLRLIGKTGRALAWGVGFAASSVARGFRAFFRGLRSPGGRLAVQSVMTLLVVGGMIAAGYYLVPSAGPAWSFGVEPEPETEESIIPLALTPEDAPEPGLPAAADESTSWSETPTADPTGTETAIGLDTWAANLRHLAIPDRALVAYGRTELISAVDNPGCNLSWTTLAGIGQTETNHGTTNGNRITADGTTLTPITGPDYNEQGPMQFLPSTWEAWGADGNGDGLSDPHNIDDATVAAANYLCTGGRDLTDPVDWYEAVHSYNPIDTYVQKVYDRADDYGQKSTT